MIVLEKNLQFLSNLSTLDILLMKERDMRLIIIGCEYTGKSTLTDSLADWGREKGIHFHLDDHFTIPGEQHLREEDKKMMVTLTPTIKERFQRFQIYYHIDVAHKNQHIILVGFHIEEAIYGPLYYYSPQQVTYAREVEDKMPSDTILILLTASPEIIAKRMEQEPHEYNVIKKEDIPMLLNRFAEEFGRSHIRRKFRIDTSNLTPEGLFEQFMSLVVNYLNAEDLLRMLVRKTMEK
jgi:thymidylate kinase